MNEDQILRDLLHSSAVLFEVVDAPGIITQKDINYFVEKLMTWEIRSNTCFKCKKEYLHSDGSHICDMRGDDN